MILRHAASLGAILLLLHLADRIAFFSGMTQSAVAGVLGLLGAEVAASPDQIQVGHLVIPWTRDCAGLNLLALFWAITLWGNRAHAFSLRWAGRLALAIPLSVLANVARILSLVGYRWARYPQVESPQLHYLIGFLWLLPFLGLLVPRRGKPVGWSLAESLHLAVTLSLAAPLVSSPGGSLLIACVLLCLAHDGLRPAPPPGAPWLLLWTVAGAGLLFLRLESLWLPWILSCPLHAGWGPGQRHWPWWLLPATLPVVAIQPWAQVLFWPLAGAAAWVMLRPSSQTPVQLPAEAVPMPPLGARRMPVRVLVLLLAPFAAGLVPSPSAPGVALPDGMMKRAVGMNGYELRFLGQSPDLRLILYGPQGDGRHHTLPVCMRFRGVDLEPVPGTPRVMTDGPHWLGEFFLLPDKPAMAYPEYLRCTFLPLAPPGSHLIVSAPTDAMTASTFEQTLLRLGERLQPRHLP